MEIQELCGILEALLFVCGEGVPRADLAKALEVPLESIDQALLMLEDRYNYQRSGLRLIQFADRVQLGTRNEYSPYIERFLQPIRKQTLSQSTLETLAIIAYRQPITRAEIEAIRGVKCDYTISVLLQKELIREVGRKDTLGRPMLFGTTDAFLRHFGLASLETLPDVHPGDEQMQLPILEEPL